MTNGGVDFSIECAGRTDTMLSALQSTYCANRVTVVLGVTSPSDCVSFNPFLLLTGRTKKGSVFGGWKGDEIPKLVDDYLKKKSNLDFLVSKKLPLSNINEGFDLLNAGKGVRSIVIF